MPHWSLEERERLARMREDGLINDDAFVEIVLRAEAAADEPERPAPPPPPEPAWHERVRDQVVDNWPIATAAAALVGALVVGVAVFAVGGADQDDVGATIAVVGSAVDADETLDGDAAAAPDDVPVADGDAPTADGAASADGEVAGLAGEEPAPSADVEPTIEDDIEYLAGLSDSLEFTMNEFRSVLAELEQSTEIALSHGQLESIAAEGVIECNRVLLTWLAYASDRDEIEPVVDAYRDRIRSAKNALDVALASESAFANDAVEELARSVADDHHEALLELRRAVPFPTEFRDEIAPDARVECDTLIQF